LQYFAYHPCQARHQNQAHKERLSFAHPSADSYLNIPALISAAEVTHADAIHPGNGFLSERLAITRLMVYIGNWLLNISMVMINFCVYFLIFASKTNY
jgi:biotin carboxylase